MSDMILWIAGEAERPMIGASPEVPRRTRQLESRSARRPFLPHQLSPDEIPVPKFPRTESDPAQKKMERASRELREQAEEDREEERRTYRGRTVAMLRRYMRYSIETGRLPSVLGREFFRAKVTSYTVMTFEDRVIFVHDMEKCLDRLDEFSRQVIARHILQEHDPSATAKLLHCNEKTVRRYTPVVLDLLSEILLDVGLLEPLEAIESNSCQQGKVMPQAQVTGKI
jgi:hypothetical protein